MIFLIFHYMEDEWIVSNLFLFEFFWTCCNFPYRIEGTTAVELASGLHWYLKYWCGAHISWDKTGGIQVASVPEPGSLPRVKDGGVIVQRPVPWNYYQNVVTSSCKSKSFIPWIFSSWKLGLLLEIWPILCWLYFYFVFLMLLNWNNAHFDSDIISTKGWYLVYFPMAYESSMSLCQEMAQRVGNLVCEWMNQEILFPCILSLIKHGTCFMGAQKLMQGVSCCSSQILMSGGTGRDGKRR